MFNKQRYIDDYCDFTESLNKWDEDLDPICGECGEKLEFCDKCGLFYCRTCEKDHDDVCDDGTGIDDFLEDDFYGEPGDSNDYKHYPEDIN